MSHKNDLSAGIKWQMGNEKMEGVRLEACHALKIVQWHIWEQRRNGRVHQVGGLHTLFFFSLSSFYAVLPAAI